MLRYRGLEPANGAPLNLDYLINSMQNILRSRETAPPPPLGSLYDFFSTASHQNVAVQPPVWRRWIGDPGNA